MGDLDQVTECDISFAALNPAQVVAMNTSMGGQLLLGHAEGFTPLP